MGLLGRIWRGVTRVAGAAVGAVVGGVAGFTVGGPVGAVVGGGAGAVGGWKAGGWVGDKVQKFAGTATGGGVLGALGGAGVGALVGFTIGGPLGSALGIGMSAMFGAQIGGTLGAKAGNKAHTARLRAQLARQQQAQFSNMGMPNMGNMSMMPGYGMPSGYGMPNTGSMGNMGMNMMAPSGYSNQSQMMMQQMMMMMMMQQMMMGGGGMNMMMMGGGQMPSMPPYGHSQPLPPFAAGAPNAGGVNMMYAQMPGMQMPSMPPYGHTQGMPPFAMGTPNVGMNSMPMMSNSMSGNNIAQTALQWQGQHFKPGQSCRCADFVSTVLRQSGQVGPNFQHQVSCQRLQAQGQPVAPNQMKAGDVVFFGNTYRQGQYTHTGIYLGNGQFIHRNTKGGPVKINRLDQGYYAQHFTGARRMA